MRVAAVLSLLLVASPALAQDAHVLPNPATGVPGYWVSDELGRHLLALAAAEPEQDRAIAAFRLSVAALHGERDILRASLSSCRAEVAAQPWGSPMLWFGLGAIAVLVAGTLIVWALS